MLVWNTRQLIFPSCAFNDEVRVCGSFTVHSCASFFRWILYSGVPVHLTIGSKCRFVSSLGLLTSWQVIVVQRIYAMYHCNKALLRLLLLCLMVQIVAEAVITEPLIAHLTREFHENICAPL